MAFSSNVWDQIKGTTAGELISALERDGWRLEPNCKGAILVYRHADGRRIGIHYHPKKTYGAKPLKGLLADMGWEEADLKRLKLIK
jgi:predicted RNA binding protein YcfA (HicA-like mRNA interferase family)